MRGPQPLQDSSQEALLPGELDSANRHTDRQTHRHGNSMSNSVQWGRVGENTKLRKKVIFKIRGKQGLRGVVKAFP